MNTIDAEYCYTKLRALFPDWQPTADLTAFWVRRLAMFPDQAALIAGIEDHRATRDWSKPSLKQLTNCMTKHARPKDFSNTNGEDEGHGMSGWYVQCYEAPVNHPGQLGAFHPLCYCRDDRIPPGHVVQRHAESMATAHASHYGGKWRVIQGSKASDLVQQRSNMQAAAKEMR